MLWLGWDSLDDENVRALQGTEFEEFARALVDAERVERWSVRGTDVEGPLQEGQTDGGIDLLIRFITAPVESEAAWVARTKGPRTLLGNGGVGDTLVISCKAGEGWDEHAYRDAVERSAGVLPVLRGGGRLLLLTTQICASFKAPAPSLAKAAHGTMGVSDASGKARVRRKLADRYAKRLGQRAEDLVARIEVVDGRDLSDYLRALRSPALALRWGEQLGVRHEAQLLSFDGWRRRRGNRPSPTWRDDPARAEAFDQVVDLLGPGPRSPEDAVLCVVGPPGIGKTRFVEQAFERAGRTALAVASEDADHVARRLEGDLLARAPSALFLVDDCTEAEVRRVRRNFIVAATSGDRDACVARLILVCPSGSAATEEALECPVIRLDPMSEAPSHEIIRAEAASAIEGAWVESVHALTQGYPWFAILVARERGGEPIITPRRAACCALVKGGDLQEAKRRARGLLAVMIAHGADWSETTDGQRDVLARAVGFDGRAELDRVIEDCETRGVVRRKRRRYVTPFVLEREVWGLLEDDGGPDRPVRRLILEHAPDRMAKLLDRLRAVGVDAARLADAVRDVLDAALPAVGSPAAFEASPLLGALRACSEVLPTETLERLASLIDRGEAGELRAARRMRRPVITALRRIQQDDPPFALLEAALFKLMLAENEAYTDRATALWTELFLHPSRSAVAASRARFDVLSRRCLLGPLAERVAAARGLVLVLTYADPRRVSLDDSDRQDYASLWVLLLDCARAEALEVSAVAGDAVATQLHAAVEGGLLDAFEAPLAEALRGLPETARLKVRRSLETERRRRERAGRDLDGLWHMVARETGGRTYGERLRERLNAPFAVGDTAREAEERADTSLLNEGLSAPDLLLRSHLDDFAQGARAPRLMILAGRLDAELVLLEALVERARDATPNTLLAFYCAGRVEAGALGDVRAWVEAWVREPRLALAVMEVMVRVGPDDAWLAMLGDLLRRGDLHAAPLAMLTWGRWERVSERALGDFLDLLATIDHPGASAVVVHRLAEGSDALTSREADALELALSATASTHRERGLEWEFMRASERLLAAGRVRPVVRALLGVLQGEDEPDAELWLLLAACARQAPDGVWDELASALLTPGVACDRLRQMLGWYDVIALLPVDRLVMWVGEDGGRGVTLARAISLASDEPPALATALVQRFGGRSPVAEALTDSLVRAPGNVRDFEPFYERLWALAARWAGRATGEVRVWLDRAADRFEREVRVRRADAPSRRRNTA